MWFSKGFVERHFRKTAIGTSWTMQTHTIKCTINSVVIFTRNELIVPLNKIPKWQPTCFVFLVIAALERPSFPYSRG